MMLRRPLKDVLEEPSVDASVMRVWARIQVQRRMPARLIRPSVAFCGALALAAFVAMVWPTAPVARGPVMVAQVPAPVANVACRVAAERPAGFHGRRPAVPEVARPISSITSAPMTETQGDVVGALLLSVEDAAREGRTEQVVAILGEIGSHHTDDPRAVEALYALGSLQLDVLHQPVFALASFQRALELQPSEELLPELWERYQAAQAASER